MTDRNIEFLIDGKEDEDVCQTCGGIGYVRTMERVYPNEPHMAPVGEEPCPDCNQKGKDDFRCED